MSEIKSHKGIHTHTHYILVGVLYDDDAIFEIPNRMQQS